MLLPEFKRGDSFELPLAVTERVTGAGLVPANIAGWLFRMSAREESASGRMVHSFSFEVTSEAEGKGVFTATPDQTRKWPLKTLVLDILVRDAEGKEVTSKTIQMNVVERVTR